MSSEAKGERPERLSGSYRMYMIMPALNTSTLES